MTASKEQLPADIIKCASVMKCMPACFVRQTNVVITIFTSLHAEKLNQEDDRTPPGFAVLCTLDYISSTPHLCAKALEQTSTGFSFLPMPVSSLPVMCRSTFAGSFLSSFGCLSSTLLTLPLRQLLTWVSTTGKLHTTLPSARRSCR